MWAYQRYLLLAVFSLAVIFLLQEHGSAQDRESIKVILVNADSFGDSVRVEDLECDRTAWQGHLGAWATQNVPICTSNAGYGRVRIHNLGDEGSTLSSLLSDGDRLRIY